MGYVERFGPHLPTCGAVAMKHFSAFFLAENTAEFWIFRGEPQKIFKIPLGLLCENLEKIPKNLPCLLVLPTESASFAFEKLNGFEKLSAREQNRVAANKIAAHFPQQSFQYAYFDAAFASSIFGVALNDSPILAQVLKVFAEREIPLLGISVEAFFLPFFIPNKTTPSLIFWEKNAKLIEIVVHQKTVLFARQTKIGVDYGVEKERLRRFLNLPSLSSVNWVDLPAASAFLNEATYAKTLLPFVPQVFCLAPKWLKISAKAFSFLRFFEILAAVLAMVFVVLTAFYLKKINDHQSPIKTLESQLPQAIEIIATREWLANNETIAPFFLENFPQNVDIFWKSDTQNFEIFLPLTVENREFSALKPQKTPEGLKIKGSRGDLP